MPKTETAWKRIRHYPLGKVPDGLPDRKPIPYRCVVAKRALLAAYECAGEDPESAVVDLLADLRHLCDRLGLAYAALDLTAHGHYREEIRSEQGKAA